MTCEGYRICEDALVCFWNNHGTWGAYTGLTSAPFTNVVTRWDGFSDSLCPASGRFVYYKFIESDVDDVDHDVDLHKRIDVADLF